MRYAEITNGVCTNITECEDQEFAAEMGWVPLPDGFGIGDSFEGGEWTKTPPADSSDPPPELTPTLDELHDRVTELERQVEELMGGSGLR